MGWPDEKKDGMLKLLPVEKGGHGVSVRGTVLAAQMLVYRASSFRNIVPRYLPSLSAEMM